MKTRLILPEIKKDFGAELLRLRGVEDVQKFLNPTIADLNDWRLLDNCNDAAVILGDLLIGNSTTGAIIGGSGKRTTETTYKTSVKNDYQIVIYLNSLDCSTITINTPYRNKVNDIISLLEYILHNRTEQNHI